MSDLDEIRGRLQKASGELDRLTAGNPGTNWRWSIPANPERDSDLILADSIADVARLLAAIEGVLALASKAPRFTVFGGESASGIVAADDVIEAITAALEAKS